MKSIKCAGLCLVAILAMGVFAGTASATEAGNEEDGPVKNGDSLTFGSGNLKLKLSTGGAFICPGTKPIWLDSVEEPWPGKFWTGALSAGSSSVCNNEKGGFITVTPLGLPLNYSIKGNDKKLTGTVKITGTSKVVLETKSIAGVPPGNCTYEASKLKGTFAIGAHGSPIPLEIATTGTFKSEKKNPACLGKMTLEGTLGVERAEKPILVQASA
jgi:hypothetical protein